ncbi:MAG: helix-turn-helix transcriptional regulator [Labilithrix sp.]
MKDPLLALDAIYAFSKDHEPWLEGIVDAVQGYDFGDGIAAYTADVGAKPAIQAVANRTRLPTRAVYAMAELLPAPYFGRIHAPMPLSSAQDFFPRLHRELGSSYAGAIPEPPDAWAVVGGDVGLETTTLVFHCQRGQAPTPRDRAHLDAIGAHLGSALRLRALLRTEPTAEHPSVDAVLAPDGRVLDARGDTKEEAVRAPLIDAVRRLEGAKLRRATSEERVEIWTALVEGRWSILERVDADGKRMLLAHRNDPRVSPVRLLSPHEQAIATYAALGHSFKYIAYELGVPLATVAVRLKSALRKLGLCSRGELIRLLAGGLQAAPGDAALEK